MVPGGGRRSLLRVRQQPPTISMSAHLYWLGQYRRYLTAMEAFAAHLDQALPLSAEQRLALRENPFLELELPAGVEELLEATEIFPSVLRRSAFLMLFALLESTLAELAEEGQRRSGNPIRLDDLRGSGFTRVVHYLSLITSIDLKAYPQWPDIHRFQLLRNTLLHRNGQLRSSDHIQDWVKSCSTLGLVEGRSGPVVRVHPGFCESAASIVESLLRRIPGDAWPTLPSAAT